MKNNNHINLIESNIDDELFITVTGEIASSAGQAVRQWMVVSLIQAFTLTLSDERC